ncbi:AsmA family protein [Methylicorpusculum sp.]|uniref:AsmA family protein n=2 Tax=Methylicorpusculum sp. TaxID=2713644 RepID=UPI00273224F0|nr:AsmA family protein [Methylicorpusculum sp.]MDP2179184.1 AsmA family protein [Methylicorpusculum sp.]MDP3531349.1 AsmA family protein [Methylicorpusculum sp.]
MNFKLKTLTRLFLVILLIGFLAFGSILLSFAYSNNFRVWFIEAIVNTERLKLDIKGTTLLEIGWQPKLTLNHISIKNRAWPRPENVATIDQLLLQISLSKLFHGEIFINDLSISKPELFLLKNKKGDTNWRFSDRKADSNVLEVPIIFENLHIISGIFHYYDEIRDMNFEGDIDSLKGSGGWQQPIIIESKGSYQHKTLNLHASAGSYSELRSEKNPYPVKLNMTFGQTEIAIRGTVIQPLQVADPTLNLSIKGPDLAELFPLTGLPLPPSSAYKITGNLSHHDSTWRFDHLEGEIGQTDLQGTVLVNPTLEPLYFNMDLFAKTLDLADLSGFIGGEPNPQDQSVTQNDSLIADHHFDLKQLRAANGKARLRATNIINKEVPITNFDGQLSLNNGVLKFEPVSFGIDEGRVNLWMSAYGSIDPAEVDIQIHVIDLSLSRIIKKVDDIQKTLGKINGKLKLKGSGNSLKDILSSSNGEAYLVQVDGKISALIVDLIGLDIFHALGYFIVGDTQIPILCAVVDADIKDGIARSKTLLLNTKDSVIHGNGYLSFKNETFDLAITPYPRDFSPLTLRSILNFSGTILKPKFSLNPLSTLMLLPPFDIGEVQNIDCQKMIKQAKD